MLKTLAQTINRLTLASGQGIAWLLLVMVLTESVVVLLRYGFDFGSIALQESVTYLHASCFLLGAAYTLQQDEHVRVDIFYRNFSEQRKALVNVVGCVLFLWPVCGFIIWSSLGYVSQAWSIREASADAGGLPGIYLLKTLIPLFAFMLMLQGLAQTIDKLSTLLNSRPAK